MPLNTNLLRAPVGIEMPDQLARMATVEQIKSAQASQETARINQQIHNESLAKTRRAQQYLEQLVPKLTSLGAPDQLEAQVLALLNAPDENLQKHGADMLKVWQQASREKRWSDRYGTPPEPAVATGAVNPPQLSMLETGPSGAAPRSFNVPPGVAGIQVGTAPRPPERINNLPGAPEDLAQNRMLMIKKAREEVGFASQEAAANPSALPFLTAAQARLQELLNSPIGEAGKTYMVNGKPVQMPLAPLESQREFDATQTDPAYAAYLQGKRPLVGVSRGERLVNPATGKVVAEGLAPEAQPMEKIVDKSGNVKLVPRSEAAGQTPASEFTGVTAKEVQKREADYPAATATLKSFEAQSDNFIKDMEKLRNHPGLSQISGILAGRIGGITSEGREAKALYDKIKAKGGFQAIQDLKNQSKTGSALGSTSNEEGRKLDASFAAIDRVQDAPSIQNALDDAVSQLRSSKQILRDKYDLTYEYRANRPAAAPAAAPAGRKPLSAFGG
jgi:hypothetical protein